MTTSPGFSWIDGFLANFESIDSSGRARAEPRRSREPRRPSTFEICSESAFPHVTRRRGASLSLSSVPSSAPLVEDRRADALGSILRAERELEQRQHDL